MACHERSHTRNHASLPGDNGGSGLDWAARWAPVAAVPQKTGESEPNNQYYGIINTTAQAYGNAPPNAEPAKHWPVEEVSLLLATH